MPRPSLDLASIPLVPIGIGFGLDFTLACSSTQKMLKDICRLQTSCAFSLVQ